jgi:TolA-binding protein
MTDWEMYTEVNPSDVTALFNLAATYYRLKEYSKALEKYRAYLERNPDSKYAEEARKRIAEIESLTR